MLFAWLLSALACALGAFLGVRAFFNPHWAARFVRLEADEGNGGFAEFRATYGGMFAGVHGVALLLIFAWLYTDEYALGAVAAGAVAVLSAGWAGTAAGRGFSMLRDGTCTQFNVISAVFEIGVAFALCAPWLAWLAGVRG